MQIYKTTNQINGKIYIGKNKTNNPKYLGSGVVLSRAIKKYGKSNFIKEIIEDCDNVESLNERETYWIKFYNSTDPNIGYNIAFGGDGGDLLSSHPNKSVIYNKIVETKRIRQIPSPMKGKNLNSEAKLKISVKNKALYDSGKIPRHRITQSGRDKLSSWMKENCPTKTEEGRLTNSLNNKGSKNPNSKSFIFIDPNEVQYNVVGNMKDFCKENGLSYKQILKVHKGLIDNHKGWTCKKQLSKKQ